MIEVIAERRVQVLERDADLQALEVAQGRRHAPSSFCSMTSGILLRAEPFDRDFDGAGHRLEVRLMDRLAILGRLERGAQRDHVARIQHLELADEAHDFGDFVVVVPRAVLGDQLATDFAGRGPGGRDSAISSFVTSRGPIAPNVSVPF